MRRLSTLTPDIGSLVKTKGIVTRCSEVKPLVEVGCRKRPPCTLRSNRRVIGQRARRPALPLRLRRTRATAAASRSTRKWGSRSSSCRCRTAPGQRARETRSLGDFSCKHAAPSLSSTRSCGCRSCQIRSALVIDGCGAARIVRRLSRRSRSATSLAASACTAAASSHVTARPVSAVAPPRARVTGGRRDLCPGRMRSPLTRSHVRLAGDMVTLGGIFLPCR